MDKYDVILEVVNINKKLIELHENITHYQFPLKEIDNDNLRILNLATNNMKELAGKIYDSSSKVCK